MDRQLNDPTIGSGRSLWCLAPALLAAVLLVAGAAAAAPPAKLVSLEARDVPLREVLQRLANQTGITFLVDDSWAAFPVSATFKDLPVDRGVRMVLGRLNHALIQLSDTRIKVVILESSPPKPGEAPGGPARDRRPPARPPEPSPPPAPQESAPAQEAPPQPEEPAASN
jgi:hypothetical protein